MARIMFCARRRTPWYASTGLNHGWLCAKSVTTCVRTQGSHGSQKALAQHGVYPEGRLDLYHAKAAAELLLEEHFVTALDGIHRP